MLRFVYAAGIFSPAISYQNKWNWAELCPYKKTELFLVKMKLKIKTKSKIDCVNYKWTCVTWCPYTQCTMFLRIFGCIFYEIINNYNLLFFFSPNWFSKFSIFFLETNNWYLESYIFKAYKLCAVAVALFRTNFGNLHIWIQISDAPRPSTLFFLIEINHLFRYEMNSLQMDFWRKKWNANEIKQKMNLLNIFTLLPHQNTL